VNEYGEGVASHHFSMKGGTSKSVKKEQHLKTKNIFHHGKGSRVKKGMTPGTSQSNSRQKDGLAANLHLQPQRGGRVKLREHLNTHT
jgi:hypothetical protein